MTSREGDAQARSTADAVARRSYGKLVAFSADARATWRLRKTLSPSVRRSPGGLAGERLSRKPGSMAADRRPPKTIDLHPRPPPRHEVAADQLKVMAEGLDAAATEAEIPISVSALMFVCAHPPSKPASARR